MTAPAPAPVCQPVDMALLQADAAARARTWQLPAPPGGAAAAVRQLAGRLADLAGAVRAQQRAAQAAVPLRWQGDGARAGGRATESAAARAQTLARGLEGLAADLGRYAAAVDAAAHQHRHFWQKVAVVGAVVAVTTAAVVVTVASAGTAAPGAAVAEAAAIDAAAAGLAAASEAAAAADAALVSAVTRTVLSSLRPMLAFVRPQLVAAEAFTGLDASMQEVLAGRIDVGRLAVGFGVDLVVPPEVARLAKLRAVRVAGPAAPHLAVGLGLTGAEAGRELVVDGEVDLLAVAATGVLGSGGSEMATRASRSARELAARRLPVVPLVDGVIEPGWLRTPGARYRVEVGDLRYAQRTTQDPLKNIVQLQPGWSGPPVDAVLRADGRLTSVDNRRLTAARVNGIDVQVQVHLPGDPLPDQGTASRFRHPKTGALPTSWGQALDNRLLKQGKVWRDAHPDGTHDVPRSPGRDYR